MSLKNPKRLISPENKIESIRAFGVVYFTLKLQGMFIIEDYCFRHKIHVIQFALEQMANDFIGALYLCVLSAHLQIIMERFANIHYDPQKTEDESFQDFIQCLEDHRIVMNIFKLIQDSISYTIFIQFIISILVFSTSGLIYLRFSLSLIETAAVFIFMVAEIVEIFPSCYYSNKFMEKTDQMVFMLYSSNWMDLSPRFRKHLIIFMQMAQEKKIILAGKQIPITLATFMSVMKAMYTMLMILSSLE
ncbi:odorant receptor 42b-like isoform X4 [Hermetia illucens]|uniref:odorant receptor 42b-like isoform X4 n=1 Tax=Hermetia illucens TaxID=343691 RepID=UPI0018CC5AAB|nr:odorant receptor 42b-like isoform X4 [Hermetia illucens]